MKFPVYSLIILFSTFSCSESDSQEKIISTSPNLNQIETQTKTKTKTKTPEVDTNLITNENVEHKLLAYGKANPETIVKLSTTKGAITIRLFANTPLHRANFIMLTKAGYFHGTVFMRVVKDFMAQTGAPYTAVHTDLLRSLGYYTIPAEFSAAHIHVRGAVAAAREYTDNPEKRSSPNMFYMVEGTRFSAESLDKYEIKTGRKFTPKQRNYYLNNPGAAHLDNEHTVFGEIVSGFEIITKITAVATDTKDWPKQDIFIEKAEVIR